MNKMQMYIKLQEMIFVGYGTAEMIVDCPHQFKEYSDYVVFELMSKTDIKDIPSAVLNKLAKEIISELDNPTLYNKVLNEIFRVFQSFRLRQAIKHNKSGNVLNFVKNAPKPKS